MVSCMTQNQLGQWILLVSTSEEKKFTNSLKFMGWAIIFHQLRATMDGLQALYNSMYCTRLSFIWICIAYSRKLYWVHSYGKY